MTIAEIEPGAPIVVSALAYYSKGSEIDASPLYQYLKCEISNKSVRAMTTDHHKMGVDPIP
jgi:hypothetical protein